MKKRLFLVPLLGGFLLSSCSFSDLMFWQKKESSQEEQKHEYKPDPKPPEDTTDHSPVLKEEFGDYKLVKSPEPGKKYILANYRHDADYMMFFNGDYHRDGDEFYPFYMGGTEEVDESAEVEIESLGDDGSFAIKVSCAESLPWNGKYIGVYSATSSFSNPVMSIALLDSPDQTEYVDPKSDLETNPTNGTFKFYDEIEGLKVYAPAAMYQNEELDAEPVPKFIGTKGEYVSFDCKSVDDALDGTQYDIAHFYEHK